MNYKLIVSEQADRNIKEIIEYVAVRLNNPEAARNIISEIEEVYDKLEDNAEGYTYCSDPFLASKGYRKIFLKKCRYVVLYIVKDNEAQISGVFHILEDYAKKL